MLPATWQNAWASSGGHHSNFLHLLPFVEQTSLHHKVVEGFLDYGGNTAGTHYGKSTPYGPNPLAPHTPYRQRIPIYLCPSDPGAQGSGVSPNAPISYAVNWGDSIIGTDGLGNGAWGSADSRGMFDCAAGGQGIARRTRGSGKSISEVGDGTSNTLLLSEIAIYREPGKLHGDYTILPGEVLRASPVVCLHSKGPSGTILGELPWSHHRIGDAWAAGFTMVSAFTAILLNDLGRIHPIGKLSLRHCHTFRGTYDNPIRDAKSRHRGD